MFIGHDAINRVDSKPDLGRHPKDIPMNTALPLLGRAGLSLIFIISGWGKIAGYAATQGYMEAMGVPGALLPLTILLEFGGGLAILFGFLTRTTALFTAGFTLLTAFLFHSNFAEGVNSLMFMKNLTIAGGYLLLAITGPGAFSIDRVLNKKW